MISDAIAVYNLIKEHIDDASLLNALFSSGGKRIEGDEVIDVKLHKLPEKDNQWFYEILPYENYIFVPFPVNPAVNVDYGTERGKTNPTSKFFRYVASPLARFSSGGEPNVEVDFLVFGYRAGDLMKARKSKV